MMVKVGRILLLSQTVIQMEELTILRRIQVITIHIISQILPLAGPMFMSSGLIMTTIKLNMKYVFQVQAIRVVPGLSPPS